MGFLRPAVGEGVCLGMKLAPPMVRGAEFMSKIALGMMVVEPRLKVCPVALVPCQFKGVRLVKAPVRQRRAGRQSEVKSKVPCEFGGPGLKLRPRLQRAVRRHRGGNDGGPADGAEADVFDSWFSGSVGCYQEAGRSG